MRSLLLAMLLSLSACADRPRQDVAADAASGANVRINQIQVLGTHNSYARPVDPRLLDFADQAVGPLMSRMLSGMKPEQLAEFREYHPNDTLLSEGLGYDHPPLSEQLDAGLRSLEIDIFNDPEGGRFVDPAGYRMLRQKGVTDLAPHDARGLDKPGFKVLHMADFDVRSHCPTFEGCLGELRSWSDAHPGHTPIFILLELKNDATPFIPGAGAVTPFDAASFEALDKVIVDGLGRGKLVTPDDVRGGKETLEAAVLAGQWPSLESARGKFVFLMITALESPITQGYIKGRPSLQGRVAFIRSKPGEPSAAFLLLDNAIARPEIADLVRKGYLVRARSDIETWEAKHNDQTRATATFSSGAQIVSTDFFRPGNRYGSPYVVRLPGGGEWRCNPVNAPVGCQTTSGR